MDIMVVKEATVEYIENIYALAINYLKNNKNIKLKNMLMELELIEDKIRLCEDIDSLENYKSLLESLIKGIEVIINE